MNDEYNELIDQICNELNIKVSRIADSWTTILEKDGITHYINGYKFDNNTHALGNIVDDKGLFFELLKLKNLPTIEHKVIMKDYYNQDEAIKYFNDHNQEIIVKGNLGTCGREVFKVNNVGALLNKINFLFKTQYSISLCPYYDIENEYRVILVNHEPMAIYGKIRPTVIGDGKTNVKDLALKFNPNFYSKKENQNKIRNPKYIPKLNEEIQLNYQFNLSEGAIMFIEIDNDLKEKLLSLASKVSKETNLGFASVDIIKTTDNQLLIMEANSGVMMINFMKLSPQGREIGYKVYKKAIEGMFNL